MLLFIVLLSLNITYMSWKWSPERAFLFTVENKSFSFRRWYSSNASLITFIADFLNSPIQYRLLQVFTLLSAAYVCPDDPNNFCFCKSKSVTPCSKLRPWTLLTVDAHANDNKNWVHLMDGDAVPFLIESQFQSQFFHSFVCLNKMISLLLSQLVHQKTIYILYKHYLEQIQYA